MRTLLDGAKARSHIVAVVLWLAAAFALPSVTASCGTDDLGEVVVNLLEKPYCSSVAEVACRNMFRCCTRQRAESVLGQRIAGDEKECRRDVEILCKRRSFTLDDALANKRARALPTATGCLRAYLVKDDKCIYSATKVPWGAVCAADQFMGLVRANGACRADVECVADHHCDRDSKCKPLPSNGQNCLNNTRCRKQSFCKAGKCAALVAAGGTCDTALACAKGTYCKPGAKDAKCTTLGKSGATCTIGTQCESGVCTPGTCDVNGAACGDDAECPKVCEGTTTACDSAASCANACSKSKTACSPTAPTCPTGETCDKGKCSKAGTACGPLCPSGETCDRAQCVGSACAGSRTCGETNVVVNHCVGSLQALLGI